MNNMASIEENICKNVKYYRTQLQMTQKDVANILKITLSSYQKLEQGQRHFSTSQLFVLSQIFDVNIAYLYDRENLDIKTNYKEQPSKILKINIQKIFQCFGIDDFSIKDISALINLIKRRGKGFLYVSKIRADFWEYSFDRQKGENYLLIKARMELEDKLKKMEKHYMENLPGIQSEIADLIRQYKKLVSYIEKLENDKNAKEQELKELKQQIRTTQSEFKELCNTHNQRLLEEEKKITIRIKDLQTQESTLCNIVGTLIPLEQYIYNPHTLDKDIFDKISACIPFALQDELDNIRSDIEDLQYDLSLFEDYGFDIENVSEKSIDEFVKKEIQEYCKNEYHGWTWSKINKLIRIALKYVEKYGMLKEFKESAKNNHITLNSTQEMLSYCLRYH